MRSVTRFGNQKCRPVAKFRCHVTACKYVVYCYTNDLTPEQAQQDGWKRYKPGESTGAVEVRSLSPGTYQPSNSARFARLLARRHPGQFVHKTRKAKTCSN